MFIFGLPTLVNHKERIRELGLSEIHGASKGPGSLHETSDKHMCFQKIVLFFPENYSYSRKLQSAKSFSTSQKITISKIVLYISENYNQQQPRKAKTIRKRKWKPEEEERGEERYRIRNGN